MRRGEKGCREWADEIRKSLMVGSRAEVTKAIEAIRTESGTAISHAKLSRPGPWTSGRRDSSLMETIQRAGLEVACKANSEGEVESVTFRLNETWRGVQERFAQTNAL